MIFCIRTVVPRTDRTDVTYSTKARSVTNDIGVYICNAVNSNIAPAKSVNFALSGPETDNGVMALVTKFRL